MTLQDYLNATYRLLRDTGQLYPQPDVIAYITEARHQRDLDTRLVRAVLSFPLVTNQSNYTLAAVSAGTLIRGETFSNVLEVVSLYVLPQGGVAGGIGIRYPLGRRPYSWASYLVSTSWPSYPTVYARVGPGTIVLAPPPAQDYAAEWDVIGTYPDLVNAGDPEPMPDPYNDALPYLAASIAKENAQRFDEAQAFRQSYEDRLRRIGLGIRQLAIPSPGADLPRGRP